MFHGSNGSVCLVASGDRRAGRGWLKGSECNDWFGDALIVIAG